MCDKRFSKTSRKTAETSVDMSLCLDGGDVSVSTGIGFLDHMLELFARHGGFGLEIKASGDTSVDFHHTAEDVGIILGRAFAEAAGDKAGINRYGSCLLPMDEALVETAVDFGGRVYFSWCVTFPSEKIGDFDTELAEEFWRAFCNNSRCNLHVIMRSGSNSHHIAEGIFKSAARSLAQALTITGNGIMSTKGVLD